LEILVGNTGFVGQNLAAEHRFDGLFHASDIAEAYGACPDLLVYAGVTGTKYMANHEPEKDLAVVKNALENIRRIRPKRLVLISSVDVYRDPVGVDEADSSQTEHMQTYGIDRLLLEQWVREEYPEALFVRLPGIYGLGLKKNFIYDYIHLVPPMLTSRLFFELNAQDSMIADFYTDLHNGFYQCAAQDGRGYASLQRYFTKAGFSAMNFTDSRGIFQYYNLRYLWLHLVVAMNNQLKRINIATEPFSIAELCSYLDGRTFENYLEKPLVHYDVHTRYASLFGKSGKYIFSKEEVFRDLKKYIAEQKRQFLEERWEEAQ